MIPDNNTNTNLQSLSETTKATISRSSLTTHWREHPVDKGELSTDQPANTNSSGVDQLSLARFSDENLNSEPVDFSEVSNDIGESESHLTSLAVVWASYPPTDNVTGQTREPDKETATSSESVCSICCHNSPIVPWSTVNCENKN